jgi:hypothetical protein
MKLTSEASEPDTSGVLVVVIIAWAAGVTNKVVVVMGLGWGRGVGIKTDLG